MLIKPNSGFVSCNFLQVSGGKQNKKDHYNANNYRKSLLKSGEIQPPSEKSE